MAKKHPEAWVVNVYMGRIRRGKIGKWAELHQRASGGKHYFETWGEAHQHLLQHAMLRLKKAKRELPNASRAVRRVLSLKKPDRSSGAN
ncbi:MAG: hypothetical protein QM750_04425 [Rubrivivax sp.]